MFKRGGIYYRWVTPSVYGGAGGHGTRISVSSHLMKHINDINRGNLLLGNEKITMQNLNDRLASYLEKVEHMEQANIKLETQIKQWYKTKAPLRSWNDSVNDKKIKDQIKDLQNQIKEAQLENARWCLKVDNSKCIAEDFKLKCDTERQLRQSVEADIYGLRQVFDELTICKTDLEIQIEDLNKDLLLLNKEHQEEVNSQLIQLGNTINVEVKAAPGPNLTVIIDRMRKTYEALAEEYRQRAKENFQLQTEELQQRVTLNTEELKKYEAQLMESTSTYQEVDIELKSQLRMNDSLGQKLQTVNAHYNSKLAPIEAGIITLQAQLEQLRTETEHKKQKYEELRGIKIQLEEEIATYRHLLERGDVISAELQLSILEETKINKTRMTKTVTEEAVEGKVLSSQLKQVEENM